MGRRQLRRSISMKPEVYAGACLIAERSDTNVTQVVERAILFLCHAHGIDVDSDEAKAEAMAMIDERRRAHRQRMGGSLKELDAALADAFGQKPLAQVLGQPKRGTR